MSVGLLTFSVPEGHGSIEAVYLLSTFARQNRFPCPKGTAPLKPTDVDEPLPVGAAFSVPEGHGSIEALRIVAWDAQQPWFSVPEGHGSIEARKTMEQEKTAAGRFSVPEGHGSIEAIPLPDEVSKYRSFPCPKGTAPLKCVLLLFASLGNLNWIVRASARPQ